MGINISQYRIKLTRTEFDFIRYEGDREIAVTDAFPRVWLNVGHPRDGESYWRPEDPSEAARWVKANIPEGNQKRWLDAFREMEDDLDYNGY